MPDAINEKAADPRVFLSYSRKDSTDTEWLRVSLRDQGLDAYLDVHDIAPGEAWQDRLHNLIAKADKVVFLISPDAVASEMCGWEISLAEKLGKTIVPVLLRETANDRIPERLQRLNFVFMRNEDEREEKLSGLVETLKIDLDWEREKARITDLASAWDSAGRPNRLLVFSQEAIRASEIWRDTRPINAPALTELQIAFIDGSRVRRSQIQRRVAIVSVVVAVVTAVAGIFALDQRQRAVKSEKVATTRAAILAADTAGTMAESGSIEEALLLLLDAASTFTAEDAPDALLIGFDRALRSASGKFRYAVSATTNGYSVSGRMLLHDPETGALSFFDGGSKPVPFGTLPGEILAIEEVQAEPGHLIVSHAENDLIVSALNSKIAMISEIGRISGVSTGNLSYAQINSQGVMFANRLGADGQGSILYDSRSGEMAKFDVELERYGDISNDAAGTSFLLPAVEMQSNPILAISAALETTPVKTDEQVFSLLRFDRCLGTAVADPKVQKARNAFPSDELQSVFLWTGSSMLHGASSFGEMKCTRRDNTVLVQLDVLKAHVSNRQTTLFEIKKGGVDFHYFNNTPKSDSIATFWHNENPGEFDPVYGIADPDFADIRIFESETDNPILREPRTIISENSVIEALVAPRAGTLLVLRAASSARGKNAVDLRLVAYVFERLQRYGASSVPEAGWVKNQGESRPRDILLLRPRICLDTEYREGVFDAVETPSGFVRYTKSDEVEGDDRFSTNFIELLNPNREVVGTFQLNVDTWNSNSSCATISHSREWVLVSGDGGYWVLPTSTVDRMAYHLELDGPGWSTSADFFEGGPSLITTDAASANVTLWEPVDGRNAEWEKSVIFTGRDQVVEARSDAEGRRLLIVDSPSGPERRGFVFSLDANRVWRYVGTGLKWMDVEFLADGSVASASTSGRQIINLHGLDEAVAVASDSLPSECQPFKPNDWRNSPCWPSGY